MQRFLFAFSFLLFSAISYAQSWNGDITFKQILKAPDSGYIVESGADSAGHWVKAPSGMGIYTLLDTTMQLNGFQTNIVLPTQGKLVTSISIANFDLNGTGARTFVADGLNTDVLYTHAPSGKVRYVVYGSDQKASLLPFLPVTNTTLTALSTSRIQVKWKPQANASGVVVEHSYDGYGFEAFANPPPTDSIVVDSLLPASTKLIYRVRLMGNGSTFNSSPYSDLDSVYTLTPPLLSKPGNVIATALNASAAELDWDPSANALGYDVQASDNDTVFYSLGTTDSAITTFTDTTITPQTQRWYQISARGDGQNYRSSDYSTAIVITTPALKVLSTPVAVINSTSINAVGFKWNGDPAATAYEIDWSSDTLNDGMQVLDTVPAGTTSYLHDNLTSGTTMYYHVIKLGDGKTTANSLPSAMISATTLSLPMLETPKPVLTAPISTQIVVNYNNIASETGYTIVYSRDKINWTLVKQNSANVTTATIDNAVASTKYYVEVQANADGVNYTDSYFGMDSITTPANTNSNALATPAPTATVNSSSKITVSWPAIPNASGYTVLHSIDNSIWSIVAKLSSTTTSFADINLYSSTTYYYQVIATGNNNPYTNSNPGLANATTQASAILTTHGVLIPTGNVSTTITAMNNLNVQNVRTAYNGDDVNYLNYTTKGKKTAWNYNTAVPGAHTELTLDSSAFACGMDSILTEQGTTGILAVFMINEMNNQSYWITSAKNVAALISAGARVAHEHGLLAYDGGIANGNPSRFLVWEDFIKRGYPDSAAAYKAMAFSDGVNLTNWRSSSNMGPKIRFLDTLVALLHDAPTDGINLHWYETVRDEDSNKATTSPLAFVETANFYSRVTGKPPVTNEYGIRTTGAISMMKQQVDVAQKYLHMRFAFWYSYPLYPLSNNDGSLTPLGTAYKNYIIQ